MSGLIAVPVYNEAGNLGRVIESLCARFPAERLLFIDDGSQDGSHRLLERAGVPYLRHPINLGYEHALRTAMQHVLESGHDYVVFFDGDGQHRVEDLERIVRSYEAEPHDLILGSRYRGAEGVRLTLRSVTTRLFSKLTSALSGVEITDVTCGLKLISRRFVPVALALPTEDMHAEMIVGLARCGARIREERIMVLPRETGQSMYHLTKGLFYPAKTIVCLLGPLLFARRLRATVGGSGTAAPVAPATSPAREDEVA